MYLNVTDGQTHDGPLPQEEQEIWSRKFTRGCMDGVLDDCPRPRGQFEDKKSWPWPWKCWPRTHPWCVDYYRTFMPITDFCLLVKLRWGLHWWRKLTSYATMLYNVCVQKGVVGQFVDVRLQYLLPRPLSMSPPSDTGMTAAQRPATSNVFNYRTSTCRDTGTTGLPLPMHLFYRHLRLAGMENWFEKPIET